jgi:hypothetical protein
VRHARPFTIGLNCALGANAMRPHVAELSDVADTFICAYPNAGLPNEFGNYDENPEFMARQIETFAREGLVNIAVTLATGRVVDQLGYSPVFLAAGLMPLIAVGAFFLMVRRVERIG